MLNRKKNAILFSLLLVSLPLYAGNTLDKVIKEGNLRASDNARSQHKIDTIVDITEKDQEEYRQLTQTLGNLKTYNSLLTKQIDDQNTRLTNLQTSLENTAKMQRDILPLIEEMISSLSQFIALDLPFLQKERLDRVEQLEHVLNQSNVDIAEKFRQVTEAYQIEMEYGRTIESYRETLTLDNTERKLSLLRVGRIALLYRSDDGQFLGAWNKASQQWQALDPSQYERSIKNAISMALKQKSPSLINTPIIVGNKPMHKVMP